MLALQLGHDQFVDAVDESSGQVAGVGTEAPVRIESAPQLDALLAADVEGLLIVSRRQVDEPGLTRLADRHRKETAVR